MILHSKRFAWVLGIAAASVKMLGLMLIRLGRPWAATNAFAIYDWLPLYVTRLTCDFIFDPRRIGPTSSEELLFDGVLVLVTGAQWYLFGVVIQWLWRRRTRDRKTAGAT
jgi:hypothetical protein